MTAAEFAVVDQERFVSWRKDGRQAGLVGGCAGTGNDDGAVAVVALEQADDLPADRLVEFFEFRASVADVIVQQRLAHRLFHQNGAGAE